MKHDMGGKGRENWIVPEKRGQLECLIIPFLLYCTAVPSSSPPPPPPLFLTAQHHLSLILFQSASTLFCMCVSLSLLYRSAFQTTWSHPSKSTFISISLCSYLLYSSFSISLTFLLMVGSFIIYICSPAVTPFFIFFFLRSCCWLAFLYMYIHDDDAIQSIGSWTRCLRFWWLLHYIVDTMDGWMDIHVYTYVNRGAVSPGQRSLVVVNGSHLCAAT